MSEDIVITENPIIKISDVDSKRQFVIFEVITKDKVCKECLRYLLGTCDGEKKLVVREFVGNKVEGIFTSVEDDVANKIIETYFENIINEIISCV